MRNTIKLVVSMLLVTSMLSGCIIDPWWGERGGHGGHGGHHGERW
jgi:hypothetical protein